MSVSQRGEPPAFCPFCAAALDIVRPIMRGWFEVCCTTGCERTAVISMDDMLVLPRAQATTEPSVGDRSNT